MNERQILNASKSSNTPVSSFLSSARKLSDLNETKKTNSDNEWNKSEKLKPKPSMMSFKYSNGDLAWAKLSTQSWWPCRIIDSKKVNHLQQINASKSSKHLECYTYFVELINSSLENQWCNDYDLIKYQGIEAFKVYAQDQVDRAETKDDKVRLADRFQLKVALNKRHLWESAIRLSDSIYLSKNLNSSTLKNGQNLIKNNQNEISMCHDAVSNNQCPINNNDEEYSEDEYEDDEYDIPLQPTSIYEDELPLLLGNEEEIEQNELNMMKKYSLSENDEDSHEENSNNLVKNVLKEKRVNNLCTDEKSDDSVDEITVKSLQNEEEAKAKCERKLVKNITTYKTKATDNFSKQKLCKKLKKTDKYESDSSLESLFDHSFIKEKRKYLEDDDKNYDNDDESDDSDETKRPMSSKSAETYLIDRYKYAVRHIRQGLSVEEACNKYRISKGALLKCLSGGTAPRGKKTRLNELEENEIVEWLINNRDLKYNDAIHLVFERVVDIFEQTKRPNPFNNGRPSMDWWYDFLSRHPRVLASKPSWLMRGKVNQQYIRDVQSGRLKCTKFRRALLSAIQYINSMNEGDNSGDAKESTTSKLCSAKIKSASTINHHAKGENKHDCNKNETFHKSSKLKMLNLALKAENKKKLKTSNDNYLKKNHKITKCNASSDSKLTWSSIINLKPNLERRHDYQNHNTNLNANSDIKNGSNFLTSSTSNFSTDATEAALMHPFNEEDSSSIRPHSMLKRQLSSSSSTTSSSTSQLTPSSSTDHDLRVGKSFNVIKCEIKKERPNQADETSWPQSHLFVSDE